MNPIFPSAEWLSGLDQKLNSDEKYARIASKWEGDILIVIQPQGNLAGMVCMYLDLWHGTCRKTAYLLGQDGLKPTFTLVATYDNIVKILTGKLDPMTAMMTRKLQVHGNMAMMMRSVPTVLDFVRCAREVTTDIL
jgi:putative sterol carrier protein